MRKQFIHEPVFVEWDQPPLFSKKPHAPDRFTWRGQQFNVSELVSEWRSYERRGRMEKNMRPEHLRRAAHSGSWGVGEYYFQVRTAEDPRIFELIYDRQPQDSDRREGRWVLNAVIIEVDPLEQA